MTTVADTTAVETMAAKTTTAETTSAETMAAGWVDVSGPSVSRVEVIDVGFNLQDLV
jgi:hypothetical protein